MTIFGSFSIFFRNFWKYLSFEAHNSDLQPNLRKEGNYQNLDVQSSYRPKKVQSSVKVRVFCYCSSNKINLVQFFESIFPFSQINFQDCFKKLSFCWYFTEYSEKFTFFEYEECHFTDHFKRFHYF